MTKCLKCKKSNDGIICSHCRIKISSQIGSGMKVVGLVALNVVPAIVIEAVKKGKTKV